MYKILKFIIYSKWINLLLFLLMIAMSFPVHTSFGFAHTSFAGLLKNSITLLALYFIIVRLYRELKNKTISVHFTEKIMIAYMIVSIISVIIINKISFLNLFHPVMALVIFLGFTSFLKIIRVSYFEVLIILHLFLFMSLFHLFYLAFILDNNLLLVLRNSFNPALYLSNSANFIGLTHNSNVFGIQMMLGVFSSAAIFLCILENHRIKYRHIIYIILLLLFMLFSIMSASRGSVLGIVVYIIATVLVYWKKIISIFSEKKSLYIYLLIFMIIGFFIFIYFNQVYENFKSKFSQGTSFRTQMWSDLLFYQLSNFPSREFFFGYGFEEFKLVNFTNVAGFKAFKHIHNLFLETWGREGLFSLVTITGLYFFAIYRNVRYNRSFWYLSMIPVAFIIHNIFEVVLVTRIIRWEVFYFYIILLLPLFADSGESSNGYLNK